MRIYLVISQIIYVLTLLPWFLAFIMTPMAFDNGFSAANISFVTIIAIYPIAVIVCSILGWKLRHKHKKAAAWVNGIPGLWILATLLLWR